MFARVSVKAPPVSVVGLLLARVRVTVELPPDCIVTGLNALAMVGAASTVRVAVLLAGPAVGVCVVVTPELVLFCTPMVLLVTLKVNVQLPLAGMAIPVKLRATDPALNWEGVVPAQLPPTAPDALMWTNVSVNAPPVNCEALLLDRVRVTTEVPPAKIDVGLNAFEMAGKAKIVNVAPAEVPPVAVTVTLAAPVAATRFAGTVAVSCVALTKVVVNAVVPHITAAPDTKPEPLTVRVNAEAPAMAEAGTKLVIEGCASTENTRFKLTWLLAESESWRVTGNEPAWVGVPLNPIAQPGGVHPGGGADVIPGGSVPVIVHLNPVWDPPDPTRKTDW